MPGETIMKLAIELGLDAGDLEKKLGATQTNMRGAVSGIGTALGAMAGVATVAIGAVATGLASCIGPASDLGESINATNVVFGEGSEIIKAYGENAANTVGLSNQVFLQMASVTGSFLQNLGFDSKAAADETINLTERAADMASVFNTDVSQAMGAIQSGLKGEFNPLEQFGVKMNATSIEAKVLEMGLLDIAEAAGDTSGVITDSMKTQAALAMIYEQTDKVAGDFQNTQDGLANSGRILSATFQDIKAAIGSALLPVLQEGAGMLKEFANGLKSIMKGGGTAEEKMTAVGDLAGTFVSNIMTKLPDILRTGAALVTGIIKGIVGAIPTIFPAVLEIGMTLINTIIGLLPTILQAGITILVTLIQGIASALPTMIPAIVQMMVDLVMVLIENLPLIIDAGIQLLLGLVEGIVAAIPILIKAAPEIILALLDALLKTIPVLLQAAGEIILALLNGIQENLPTLIEMIPDIIFDIVTMLIDNLPLIINAGLELIGALGKGIAQAWVAMWPELVKAGGNIVEGIKTGFMNVWSSFKNALSNLIAGIPTWIKKILGIASPSKVFMEIGEAMGLGLTRGWEDTIKGQISSAELKANAELAASAKVYVPPSRPTPELNPLGNTVEMSDSSAQKIGKYFAQELAKRWQPI